MTVNTQPRLVFRAQRAIREGSDTRALKRELLAGNPYIERFLRARGLSWNPSSGTIFRPGRG